MSRGFGKQQTAILRKMRTLHEEGHQITAEELRWVLYFEKKEPEQDSENLPKSWCNAFQIALAKLEKGKHIKVRRRVLENFDECLRHYPGKTPNGWIRQLRKRMLPYLATWKEAGILSASPKYNLTQNEVFRFQKMSKSEQRSICEEWEVLAPQLEAAYKSSTEPAEGLFLLLCKGREYFLNRDIHTGYSMTELVESLKPGILPTPLSEDLETFMRRFMPEDKARALEFRSIIHRFANIPSLGTHCELHEGTLEHLYHREPRFIEAMEGTTIQKSPWKMPLIGRTKEFDPRLRRLFDHSVFREFQFLEPVSD
jgi:hypothetical protein